MNISISLRLQKIMIFHGTITHVHILKITLFSRLLVKKLDEKIFDLFKWKMFTAAVITGDLICSLFKLFVYPINIYFGVNFEVLSGL